MKRQAPARPKPFQNQSLPTKTAKTYHCRPSQYENAHFFPATYATLASLSPRACWQPVELSATETYKLSPEIFQTTLKEVESNLYAMFLVFFDLADTDVYFKCIRAEDIP